MKKAIFCLFGFVAFIATPALAADMPAPAVAPPPADARWNWTGFYIGGGAGGAWTRSETKLKLVNGPVVLYNPADVGRMNALGSPNLTSFTGTFTGRVGYNYQTGPYVWGLEGTASYIHFSKSIGPTIGSPFAGFPGGFAFFNTSVSTSWVATIGPRFGYAMDRVMFYLTGGAAFGTVGFSNSYVGFSPNGFGLENEAVSTSQTKVGWMVGGGFDYGINQNWILSVDYQHVDLGYLNASGLVTTGNAATAVFNFSTLLHTDIFTLGVAYKF